MWHDKWVCFYLLAAAETSRDWHKKAQVVIKKLFTYDSSTICGLQIKGHPIPSSHLYVNIMKKRPLQKSLLSKKKFWGQIFDFLQ